jgi:hypothetical protein
MRRPGIASFPVAMAAAFLLVAACAPSRLDGDNHSVAG